MLRTCVCMDVGTLYYEQNISNKHTQKPLNEFQWYYPSLYPYTMPTATTTTDVFSENSLTYTHTHTYTHTRETFPEQHLK